MKKLFAFPLLFALALAATSPEAYKVDVASSILTWKGYKVTGDHSGTVKVKSGSLQFTDGSLSGGTFVIDMTSIKDTDLEGEWAAKAGRPFEK